MGKLQLTVIIAGYRIDGVRKSIEDLEKQTANGKFDVIIVNDGQQELREEVPKLIAGKPNYHFIDSWTRNHYYGGVSRNMAAMMAFMYRKQEYRDEENEFLLYHDDDVLFESPDFIQKAMDRYEGLSDEERKLTVLMPPEFIEFRGKIDPEYRHKIHVVVFPNNIDLNGVLYKRKDFINVGCFPCGRRFRVSYDIELIKKLLGLHSEKGVKFVKGNTLIFYHKKR